MTLIQFIARLQVAYPREQLGNLRQLYLEELAQFTERQLESMWSPIIRRCTFLPKISEIYTVASLLDFLDVPASQSINSPKIQGDCLVCDGLGWERVTLPHPKGGEYEAVRECQCTGKESNGKI